MCLPWGSLCVCMRMHLLLLCTTRPNPRLLLLLLPSQRGRGACGRFSRLLPHAAQPARSTAPRRVRAGAPPPRDTHES